tara:strand:- start:1721 stop:2296 length:576 start_codon:yes stop_codon:yes gene_type:complete
MIKNKDFILHKKGYYSAEECQQLINYYEWNSSFHREGRLGPDYRVDHKSKKCTEMGVNICENDLLFDKLQDCLEEYKEDFPFLNEVQRWDFFPKYNIQKYNPTEGYFSLHCENSGKGKEFVDRNLAWMVYLNDVTDGGETEFPTQGKKFSPGVGDVLIWPAYWTHPHRGIVSMTQTKYIATGWCCYINKNN